MQNVVRMKIAFWQRELRDKNPGKGQIINNIKMVVVKIS